MVKTLYYKPLPHQLSFHEAIGPRKSISGKIASGKTTAIVHEAIRLAVANPGRTGLLGAASEYRMRSELLPALWGALEGAPGTYEYVPSSRVLTLLPIGSRVLLRSFDDAKFADRLRGISFAWYAIDNANLCPDREIEALDLRTRDTYALERCCAVSIGED